jgi:GWxTD domain-containing protein
MTYPLVFLLALAFSAPPVWADEPEIDQSLEIQAVRAQAEKDFEQAQSLFEQYIQTLSPEEQALYLDISYVASGQDLKIYQDASVEEKQAVERRFWVRTDPSPLTRVNERLVEHYRRVGYARHQFGLGKFPWDDRGEVYIRFGAPEHISSSNDLQIEMDREVQDARDQFVRAKKISLRVTPGQPIFPVPDNTAWTYWVYTRLNQGTEFTFIRQYKGDVYRFPSVPDGLGVGLTTDLLAYQGRVVLDDLVSRDPWVYEADFSQLPIDFYYYPATFRGANGQTRLEIYYGLPASEMSRLPVNETTDRILLDRGLAIFDSLWVEQYRVEDQLTFRTPSQKQIMENAFIPGMMAFDVKPGSNYLALQVRDVLSGKSQVYQQVVDVQDYSDRLKLMMSDIELAFWIAPTDQESEFTKKGLRVVPMASKAFRKDQTAFVFFEVYNLERNAFGQTRYTVSYVFQSQAKGIPPVRALRGLGRMLKLREKSKEIAISYEQTGSSSDDMTYVELDLHDVEPGGQKVRVELTDELTGEKVRKEILFDIVP